MPDNINDELIRNAIEQGLDALGKSPKQAMWFCLEKDFGFDRTKLPENIKTFEEILQKFFGLGYNFLEMLFIKNLHEATGKDLQGCNSLSECVERLRAQSAEKTGSPTTASSLEVGVVQPETVPVKESS